MVIAKYQLEFFSYLNLNLLMNTTQQTSEQLLKSYIELSSTIFSSNSTQEISVIKDKLLEIRQEMKNSSMGLKK